VSASKDSYLTEENIDEKCREWLDLIGMYALNRQRFRFVPEESALIIIDMQNFFVSEGGHAGLPAASAIVPGINRMADGFRKLGQPVIFTRHGYKQSDDPGIMDKWWGDNISDDDEVSELSPLLNNMPSESVLRKVRYSAFHGTNLEQILIQNNIKSVVITGVMTHLCCETTAREAFMKNYEVYFVIDGTATANEDLHISSLKTLSHGFAVPVTTAEILASFL